MPRGVLLAVESNRPIARIGGDLGIHPEALRKRVRRAKADAGQRQDLLNHRGRSNYATPLGRATTIAR